MRLRTVSLPLSFRLTPRRGSGGGSRARVGALESVSSAAPVAAAAASRCSRSAARCSRSRIARASTSSSKPASLSKWRRSCSRCSTSSWRCSSAVRRSVAALMARAFSRPLPTAAALSAAAVTTVLSCASLSVVASATPLELGLVPEAQDLQLLGVRLAQVFFAQLAARGSRSSSSCARDSASLFTAS
jgi:hypothetical protein